MATTNTDRAVIRPPDLRARWAISGPTLWRMERDGRAPPRDFFIAGRPVGWRVSTIEAVERGEPIEAAAA